jgi:anti-sigma factor ChrR (cupin superfamily)
MINEQQQEQASLYVLGALTSAEASAFEAEVRASDELRDLVRSLQRTTGLLAMASPAVAPPRDLRDKVLRRIDSASTPAATQPPPTRGSELLAGLRFLTANDQGGWKQLPVPGAWIKLLSMERERGYAVLLGKLEPGVRYPAHLNVGPEDIYILSGDLHVSGRRLGPGDFHHADAGSQHEVNYSVEGCTLLAVLTNDHPLVEFAAS